MNGDTGSLPSLASSRMLLWGAMALLVAQTWYWWGRVPDRVASHFGASGQADGWAPKEVHLGLMLGIAVLMLAMFEGLVWLLPRMPADVVNIPNRDYWLAPERRQAASRRLGVELLDLGTLTLIWLVALNEIILRANLSPEPRLAAGFWIAFTVYLVVVGLWTLRFYRRFGVPPESARSGSS